MATRRRSILESIDLQHALASLEYLETQARVGVKRTNEGDVIDVKDNADVLRGFMKELWKDWTRRR